MIYGNKYYIFVFADLFICINNIGSDILANCYI